MKILILLSLVFVGCKTEREIVTETVEVVETVELPHEESYQQGFDDGYEQGYEDGHIDGTWGYEQEVETRDVGLLAGEAQKRRLHQKASRIAYTYSMEFESALSLVTLGQKINKMRDSFGHLTEADRKAITGDLETLTGVTLDKVMESLTDPQKQKALISNIADKIGTSAQNLETRILPELFSIHL